MRTAAHYEQYRKPSWAPPARVFGPVWTVLYLLIAVSFGYVGYSFCAQSVPFSVLFPFVLNLVFNFAFTPIQFRLRNFALASIDILLVLATLIWALIAVYPIAPWVAWTNIPYLLWVSFATVLQFAVTAMNR